ncbi:hypothetical protein RI444_15530 [Paenarthrobacter sp. AT5]|uniref:hypothetical protein n=1 Tax=Paenarthrobacter TaxID=1742992 RepID=UPI001A9999CF|nr:MULTISPECIES: hypothetical protein [Paenarthrobacter]QSZ53256.1 hypothetical protein AYX19_09740 [Paenarthrobacter ureafaciens]WOC59919.1 hypothetical protein RI444_15530 [Paenarthrobacter sp. AT5]
MRDKAGNVYSAVGGILAGAGAGAFLAGATTSYSGWALPWTLGVAVPVTALGLYMILAVSIGWWLPWRQSRLERIIDDARRLSAEIEDWHVHWRNAEYWSWHDKFLTAEQPLRDELWRHETERTKNSMDRMADDWEARFTVRVLTSFDLMVEHGAKPLEHMPRKCFEYHAGMQGMQEIGTTLGVMASKLEVMKSA